MYKWHLHIVEYTCLALFTNEPVGDFPGGVTTIARVGIECKLAPLWAMFGAGVAFGTAMSGCAMNGGITLRGIVFFCATKTETVGDLSVIFVSETSINTG